jgi:membrane-associated phospholipid phosphatase
MPVGLYLQQPHAILRIANNKHYSSDVLAGAGIGLLSGI